MSIAFQNSLIDDAQIIGICDIWAVFKCLILCNFGEYEKTDRQTDRKTKNNIPLLRVLINSCL